MIRFFGIVILALCATLSLSAQPRFLWTKLGKGPSFDEARAIAVSPQGDIRIAGVYSDSIIIGDQTLQSSGNYDMFMARFTKSGMFLLSDTYGGLDVDDTRSICVDNKGNFYLTGTFAYSAFIGEDVFADGEASVDIVVAKWNSMGILQWTKVFGGKNYDESAPFISCDSTGNVYLAGIFGGTNVAFGNTRLNSSGAGDMFLAKLNAANGDVIWAKNGGGFETDEALAVSVTKTGDLVYVAGTFKGMAQWAGNKLESVDGKMDFFYAAYDNAGNLKWIKKAGHPGDDRVITCVADQNGDMLITGAINNQTTWDGQSIKANGEFRSDLVLARVSKLGVLEKIERFGDVWTDVGYGITTDARNNIYIAGAFDSTTVISGNSFGSQGGRDAFVMKLRSDFSFDWFRSVGGPNDDEMRAVAVDKQNIPYVCGTFDTKVTIDEETLEGERYLDVFLGAIECGPNTALRPATANITVCQGGDSTITAPDGYPAYVWSVNGSTVPQPTRNVFDLSVLPVGEHKIKVRITDQNDCSLTSKEVTVTVTEGMAKPVIAQDGMKLTCSIDGATYVWYREGKLMSNVKTREITAPGNGLYRVRVTDSTGCTRWSDPVVIGSTSVDEDAPLSGITVYPNPTQGDVHIGGLPDGASILLVDVLGRSVEQRDGIAGTITLPLGNHPHGLYTLVIRTSAGELTRLVLKR